MPFTPSGILWSTMAEHNFARTAAAGSDTSGKTSDLMSRVAPSPIRLGPVPHGSSASAPTSGARCAPAGANKSVCIAYTLTSFPFWRSLHPECRMMML